MSPVITKATIVVDASAEDAWAVLGDYANDPLWRAAVTRMDQYPSGPVHDGATAVEELHLLGRTTRTTVEVYDVRPARGFAWRATAGSVAHGIRTITPLSDGRCTLSTWRRIELAGADRLLQPLVSWLLARAERADLRRAAALVVRRRSDQVAP